MSDSIVNGITGLLGVFLGVYLSKHFSQHDARVNLLLDLHREFSGPEMSVHRAKMDFMMKAHPDRKVEDLELIDNDKTTSIYVLMRFYQKLWLCIKYRKVNKNLALEMFPEVFYYHYYCYFKHHLAYTKWMSATHLDQLADWFAENVEEERHGRIKNLNLSKFDDRTRVVVDLGETATG